MGMSSSKIGISYDLTVNDRDFMGLNGDSTINGKDLVGCHGNWIIRQLSCRVSLQPGMQWVPGYLKMMKKNNPLIKTKGRICHTHIWCFP